MELSFQLLCMFRMQHTISEWEQPKHFEKFFIFSLSLSLTLIPMTNELITYYFYSSTHTTGDDFIPANITYM